ncbi:hypothetical protein C10C_0106 [Chlamydia serpentis]|uniref:Uncharacterized protein n=1 Tax=Chlamydia serpentis TaxID=1967782 RepID=A0A2R8FAE1_9CHLA|nr:hypothetical protein [Chlamydia serpentis]SPN73292.1 hypothetical protein C10C_0106 [Chlamydia serpentis]
MVRYSPVTNHYKESQLTQEQSSSCGLVQLSLTVLSLFLTIAICVIILLTGLLPNTLLIAALCILSVIFIVTGISILFQTHCCSVIKRKFDKPILEPKLPKKTPSLTPDLLNILRNKVTPSDSSCLDLQTSLYRGKQVYQGAQIFFPSPKKWNNVFLKDPNFLIKSALTSWTIIEEDSGYALSHLHMDPTVFVTSESLETLRLKLEKKNIGTLGVASQVSFEDLNISPEYDDGLIQTVINNATYYFPIVKNKKVSSNQLYEIFKKFFIHYHNLFSIALEESQVLLIHPLITGSENLLLRKIEVLAFLCVFEQLNYNEYEYVLEPEDYLNRFIYKKNLAPPNVASFGLIQGYEERSCITNKTNNIRNVVTRSIVLSCPLLYQVIKDFNVTRKPT